MSLKKLLKKLDPNETDGTVEVYKRRLRITVKQTIVINKRAKRLIKN